MFLRMFPNTNLVVNENDSTNIFHHHWLQFHCKFYIFLQYTHLADSLIAMKKKKNNINFILSHATIYYNKYKSVL